MRGLVSFHPVDLEFFDELLQPLLADQKVNPETYLETAMNARRSSWTAKRYINALELLLESLEPPPPVDDGSLWNRVRSRLERFDHKPDPLAITVARTVEPDLQLLGRPFFIAEGSADRVATVVDEYLAARGTSAVESLALEQLVHLDKSLGQGIGLDGLPEPGPDMSYRTELLNALKELHQLARAAARDEMWNASPAGREPASEVLAKELPWQAMMIHSRAVPFWVAENVDGLETVCQSAGVPAPTVLAPAWRLFGEACERFPALREELSTELTESRQIGAFVAPSDVPELLEFLTSEGAKIIQVATRHDQGPTCTTLLRKIRECARYAEKHGRGYLEASGIPPLNRDAEEDEESGS